MTSETAAQILEDLVLGIDPSTGRALRDEDPCCQPVIRDALELAIGRLRFTPDESPFVPPLGWLEKKSSEPKAIQKKVSVKQKSVWKRPANRAQAGKRWTETEDACLIEGVRAGLSAVELAEICQRGIKAVEVRLVKLGFGNKLA